MKYILHSIVICLTILLACNSPQKRDALCDNYNSPTDSELKLTELFSTDFNLIPLETNNNCLLGHIKKIAKFQNHYYVLASNDESVYHFDEKEYSSELMGENGKIPTMQTDANPCIIEFFK